jgi:hypothetical protein
VNTGVPKMVGFLLKKRAEISVSSGPDVSSRRTIMVNVQGEHKVFP